MWFSLSHNQTTSTGLIDFRTWGLSQWVRIDRRRVFKLNMYLCNHIPPLKGVWLSSFANFGARLSLRMRWPRGWWMMYWQFTSEILGVKISRLEWLHTPFHVYPYCQLSLTGVETWRQVREHNWYPYFLLHVYSSEWSSVSYIRRIKDKLVIRFFGITSFRLLLHGR